MTTKTNFDAVAFVRGVRDKQAALLEGKTSAEVLRFFSSYGKERKRLATRPTRAALARPRPGKRG